MKRKLTAILSFILALVMCFALAACGNNSTSKPDNTDPTDKDKPTETEKTALTYGKLADSLDRIVSSDGGYKATVTYGVNSKNDSQGTSGSLALEKRGNAVSATFDGNGYIFNFDTGYLYTADTDGKYVAKQMFAGGAVDYMLAVVGDGTEPDYDRRAEVKGYDKESKTLTYKHDVKDEINSAIEPLISEYANEGTLYSLANKYIDKFYLEGVTLDDMLETGATMVVMFKDKTVESLLAENGITLTEILESAGVEISEELSAALKTRTFGEALTGAFEYADTVLGGGTTGFDLQQLLYNVFEKKYTEITDESLTASVNKYGELVITMLKGFTVKDVVDMIKTPIEGIPAELTNTLYTVITEGVKLTKAEINFTLSFDDALRVTKLAVTADLAHSYTAETDLTVLADNDYHAETTLDISGYNDATERFDIAFAENPTVGDTVYYVADGKADAKIYIELSGKTAELNFTQVAAVVREHSETGISYKVDGTPIDAAAYVGYDGATTTLTVRKALFDELKKGEGFGGACAVIGTITVDGAQKSFNVYIDGVTDDPASLVKEIVQAQLEVIMGTIGGNTPPTPPDTAAA